MVKSGRRDVPGSAALLLLIESMQYKEKNVDRAIFYKKKKKVARLYSGNV